MPRIAVLWDELPGYAVACVRALGAREGVALVVVRHANPGDKAFDKSALSLPVPIHTISAQEPFRQQWSQLRTLLADFRPDVALVSGWAIHGFNSAARWVHRRGGRVICMSDNPWQGDLKHVLGARCARLLFRKRYDAMFVPGERARPLANALGFTGTRLITGSYSCDWSLYSQAFLRGLRHETNSWPQVFLFVGRLIARKGLPDIIEAFRAYRREVSMPWKLWVVGDGPLRSSLDGVEGVVPLGFRQPVECAELMAQAGAFVLASYKEPWGVVIHEATAAGLPVICTEVCGAAGDLVSDGHNGYLFAPGDVGHLRDLMHRLTAMRADDVRQMGSNSFELSKQFTPELWADRLLRKLEQLG